MVLFYYKKSSAKRVLVKYKVDKVRKVGKAKLHISLKIEQCGKVGKVGASFPTNPNI